MSSDLLIKYRIKKKFTLEIRYPPILEAFDNRGKVLSILHNLFQSKIPHWRVSSIETQLLNDNNKPSKIISVDHKTTRIIYEDPGSLQEFEDDAKKLIENIYSIFENNLNEIIRVGVRFQSIFSFPEYNSFELILNKLKEILINPNWPLTVTLTDCQYVLRHDAGQILLGPIKEDEIWIKENFLTPEKNIPKYGLGLDIDSYAQNTTIHNSQVLFNLFRTVEELTLATEKEITSPFFVEAKN